jgi:hypothetical protein
MRFSNFYNKPNTTQHLEGGANQWRTAVSPRPRATIWTGFEKWPGPYATVVLQFTTVCKLWADV